MANEKINPEFCYSCLTNSLVLFAANEEYLNSLSQPAFDPLFEIESEFDYAFLPVIFQGAIDFKQLDEQLISELLNFKGLVNNLSDDIWDWDQLFTNSNWIELRTRASELLDRLEITDKVYDYRFTNIHKVE